MEKSSQPTPRVSTLCRISLHVCTLTFVVPVWCRELQELLKKAQSRAEGQWYKRLLRSARDEETLKVISADLTDMLQRYQVRATYVQL